MSQSSACAQIGRRLLLVLAAAVMSGCGVKSSFITPYRAGQYQQAAVDATQVAESASKGDSVYYRLEQGAILRAAGQIEQSNKAFDIADDTIHKYDDEPEVKLSQETAAAFTNLSTLEYRGFCYDRIMLNVYKALNCMELGKLDAARVELARVYERQKEAVDRYAKKIEKDKALREAAASKKDTSGYDVSKAEDDKRFQASRDKALEGLDDMAAYENYVNPFAEYVHGVFLLSCAQDASDRENAVTSFKRVAGMVKDNPYIAQDLESAQAAAAGKPLGPTTYVFFESGSAPERGEIRIDVPVFIASVAMRRDLRVDYVGANIPRLKPLPPGPEYLEINAAGNVARTSLICNMDAVIAREFKNELPMVITKTIIAAGTKAAAAYAVNEATRGNQWGNIIARVATTAYQVWQNQADLRTWRTLPKHIHLARLATPPDHQITVAAPGGQPVPVQLADARVNVVIVKAVAPNQNLTIRQFQIQ